MGAEPKWITEGRKLIGLRETPGPGNTKRILDMFKRIGWGGTYKADSVPWCGAFVGDCMVAAGIEPPKTAPRALDWAKWGKAVQPQVGAIVTMTRDGGGHVCFLVGQNGNHYLCLGGNQSDAVNIMAFPKSRISSIRWPLTSPELNIALPTMPMATVSTREA